MKKLMVMFLMVISCFGGFSKHKHRKHKTKHRIHHVTKKKHRKHGKRNTQKHNLVSPEAIHNAAIEYSEQYGVPHEIVFSVMYHETGYKGIEHKKYNYRQRSRCGAVGPMQIMPRYARNYVGHKISSRELINNPILNIKIGVRMLSDLHKRYKSWGRALGAYNTGKPSHNAYSRKVLSYSKSKTFFNCPV